ncbi:MAG TPA: lysylphosphatidylglycerol synthase domain-containing protein [Methylibium sp.]|uniref:lysylphosphatidylglycerol synthase domain-containing protein n=1 Tax=Methylibium sp. TaxID=2067992 RepID=UPI002DB736F3|nr:lysylphosphatidylglycerol synthase domain-containing protein [Methylibium sp.]HEU4458343.1 lysylphosphatidylglycerol synthase domain-containing protein [Methylibium sp.]
MKAAQAPKRRGAGLTRRPWWPAAKRTLLVAFFALVGWLLYEQAREIEWSQVGATLARYPWTTLALAAALAAASHAIYSGFDLIGKHWTGHTLPVRQVVPVTFVSYAFNLNLGSLVGGIAFRYRLYARLGLDNATTTRVLAASLVTNWLGYLALAGVVFALGIVTPPEGWKIGALALRGLGAGLLFVALAYLLLCAFSKRREWSVRGHSFELPPLRLALLQFGVSTLNWSLIAGVVFVLLGQRIDYPVVLGVLLLAAVAGVVAHIPAGLGVLEAVFVALLGGQIAKPELLAALIAYRAIYYLAPLAIAIVVYLRLEAGAKKSRQANQAGGKRRRAPDSPARPASARG